MIRFRLGFSLNLDFVKIGGRWYVDYPEYPGNQANLEMVAGADDLCESLSEVSVNGYGSKQYARVEVSLKRPSDGSDIVLKKYGIDALNRLFSGRLYTPTGKSGVLDTPNGFFPNTIWLCPVMLYTFGGYPDNIYIKNLLQ